jgi:hypothetical protein
MHNGYVPLIPASGGLGNPSESPGFDRNPSLSTCGRTSGRRRVLPFGFHRKARMARRVLAKILMCQFPLSGLASWTHSVELKPVWLGCMQFTLVPIPIAKDGTRPLHVVSSDINDVVMSPLGAGEWFENQDTMLRCEIK